MLGGPIWGGDTVVEMVMGLLGSGVPQDQRLFGHLRTLDAE